MLGQFLRGLRGSRRAADVAEAIGVVKSAIYLWESDTTASRRPTPSNLQALLDHYGATPEERLRAWELTAEPRPEGQPRDAA